ncbi:MAG: Asp-tRNA(Asn)/Glu-tRNA(Gln) amidotransferase subunit GatC [Phycisphaerae bacterium]
MPDRIDPEEVRRIAHLSRLKLTDDELTRFGGQLASLLTYFDKLQELDTEGVEPTAHAVNVENVFRDDEPVAPLTLKAVLANAPAAASPYFKVPKVLDPGAGDGG